MTETEKIDRPFSYLNKARERSTAIEAELKELLRVTDPEDPAWQMYSELFQGQKDITEKLGQHILRVSGHPQPSLQVEGDLVSRQVQAQDPGESALTNDPTPSSPTSGAETSSEDESAG